jgi:hypothetical protein
MTHERFQQFLQSPELLSAIPYEELKTLALTYPYAANLQVLLLLKSAQEQHPDEERNRATAAAYSLDRKLLFCLLTERAVVPLPALEMEVLELKPLSTLPAREERAEAPAAEMEMPLATGPQQTSPDEDVSEEPLPEGDISEEEPPHAEALPTPSAVGDESAAPAFSADSQRFATFAEWANHFNPVLLTRTAPAAPPASSPAAATPAPALETPEKTPGIAQQLAQKSVSENPDIASETLARLYAQQGYRDKAIEMYRRLMVLHPEKSAFFAAQIEALTKHT